MELKNLKNTINALDAMIARWDPKSNADEVKKAQETYKKMEVLFLNPINEAFTELTIMLDDPDTYDYYAVQDKAFEYQQKLEPIFYKYAKIIKSFLKKENFKALQDFIAADLNDVPAYKFVRKYHLKDLTSKEAVEK